MRRNKISKFNIDTEANLSRTIKQMLDTAWRPNCVWFHVPNGFWGASIANVQSMISQGMTPGVADWILMWEHGCCAVELKLRGKKVSAKQLQFQGWCQRNSVPYYVVSTPEEFEDVLKEFKLI